MKHSLFVIASLIFALLVYSGAVKRVERYPYNSLLSLENVKKVEGVIYSVPTKTSSGRYYKTECALRSAEGFVGEKETRASASGHITVLVPSKVAESMFPGKLYNSAVYLDVGENIALEGKSRDGIFFAESVKTLGYQGAFGALNAFRASCRLSLRRLLYSWKEAGGLLLALVSGCREYLPQRTASSFRSAGISHILALSGMHLVFISGNLALIFYSAFGKKYKLVALLASEILFVWFAGISPSLFRALLCSVFSIMSAFCYKKINHRLNFLSFAFLLHAIIFPNHVFEVSFMLSYAACAGIFAFADIFEKKLFSRLPKFFSSDVSLSLSAQSFTVPVSALIFHAVVPFSLVASVVISPIVSVFMLVGLLGIALCLLFPFLSPLFAFCTGVLYKIIAALSLFFASLPSFCF